MQDSIRFASAGDDLKIWDSSSMTVVEQFNPHVVTHPVSSLCWSSNNHFLVTASSSGDKIVVSSCKSKPVPLLELAEGKKQTCVNLNSTSQYVVSGGLDNTVNIWDLKSKRLHRSLKDHKDEVTCVTFNGNDSYIASGSMSGEIILHNVTTNLSSTPFGHGSSQSSRSFSSKSSIVSTAVNKKPAMKTSAGVTHNANIIKDVSSAVTTLPQPSVSVENKGLNVDIPGFPRSTSLDIIPSKETDFVKTTDLKSIDSFGRSSLGDIFSPVRDDASHFKGVDELSSKGNDLDYLAHFGSMPSSRRNPVGANTQGIHSSPLHLIIGSPIKEEDESQDLELKTRQPHPQKQDLKEHLRQHSKPADTDQNNLSAPVNSVTLNPEVTEKMVKQTFTPPRLKQDLPANGTKSSSPKVAANVSAELATSLSEKIAGAIAGDKTGAPLTSVQINFIKNMIEETLDDFREACHRDIVNLQVEMIKQFHIQSSEIQMLLERYSVNESLVTEIEKLREENKRLRANF
ncbi:hypothetical protein GDO86_005632 [Hymenochirus boettgeri]|uniref:NEDD1 gamma-tubulin ring complex targeting factor n=1 Tax=Hymenochirus boettgeri TaxID=247094 RepID=A0A8T2J848_9PIPI|nr:hypothetical protein GDO86_005632 [Hymenochirus boettgeri]